MHYPVPDFFSAPDIPPLTTNVAARTTRNIHFRLVGVAAVGALPNQLAAIVVHNLDFLIPAAHLAVVGFRVQLRIHDVVVDVLQHRQYGGNVVREVCHFDVADCSARRELLELRLKSQLIKSIDMLCDVNVIGVGDVALIGDALNHTKALLQTLGKFIGGGLQRRTVEGEIDIALLLPLPAGVVHVLHHLQGEGGGGGVRMALAGHVLHALVEAGVAQGDGGVAVICLSLIVQKFSKFNLCFQN